MGSCVWSGHLWVDVSLTLLYSNACSVCGCLDAWTGLDPVGVLMGLLHRVRHDVRGANAGNHQVLPAVSLQ